MKLIVIDLEMNQPSGLIIEVGACIVDTDWDTPVRNNLTAATRFSEIANPGELPSVFIAKLTGIHVQRVSEARTLKNVLDSFWVWAKGQGCSNRIAGWGNDVDQIIEASNHYKCSFKWPKVYDIKQFVNISMHMQDTRRRTTLGLNKVCKELEIDCAKPWHRALPDAINAAEAFRLTARKIGGMK